MNKKAVNVSVEKKNGVVMTTGHYDIEAWLVVMHNMWMNDLGATCYIDKQKKSVSIVGIERDQ